MVRRLDRRGNVLEANAGRSRAQGWREALVTIDIDRPYGMSGERHPLTDRTAEQIAASADRLEQQAAGVRAADKQLALWLMKEATKLRRVARGLDIQHKQAERARMRRKHLSGHDVPPDQRNLLRPPFFSPIDDDVLPSLG